MFVRLCRFAIPLLALLLGAPGAEAETFRVVTYNVENYLDEATDTRFVKAADARAKVRESIRVLKPDVLALEEMGSTNALLELRDSLKAEGLDLPYWEHVAGFDTNIFVAVLSRFPFAARRPHTKDSFLLNGRRYRVGRGFAEVDIQVNPNYSFTLIAAHLKSKRTVADADEAELRLEEAKLLREKIDARFAADPGANLVVLGDFNDTKDSPSTRAVIGRGRHKLVDTRPAERNGDNTPSSNPAWDPRNVTWTHYYGKEDSYSRIDFLLISPGLAREWVAKETYILTLPNWGVGSDHRPIMATFEAADR
ncbi:MAG TPA: endonuclease/exonuclease/phosphatase family protein [Verrucomicrobiota bacterium]|nr:endonuclease/exonuclease/phosphatase family protein [Verrucomicrobiota bacterium]HQL76801.1 endonuclease/exonuclease/phosphatase family protein [Verrucomicrobiota bacterium]